MRIWSSSSWAWAQWTPILSSPLVFFVWFWTYNFILRKILKEQEVQLPSIQHLRFCLKHVVLGCSSRATSAKSNGFVTPWGTAFKILTAEPWNLLDAMAFHTELQDLRGQTNLGASGIRFDVEWNFITQVIFEVRSTTDCLTSAPPVFCGGLKKLPQLAERLLEDWAERDRQSVTWESHRCILEIQNHLFWTWHVFDLSGPPFKMPQTVPMQPFCCVLAPAVFRPPIWWHFRILLTVEHCDHCGHEIHNRVWVLELELNELRFWVLLWSFSCGSEPNFILRKILKEHEVQLPPFKMPQTVPMQPFCCVLAPAVFRPPIWWHFRILLTVEHCDHCEHEIHNRVWVLELELNELRFWVLLWSFSYGSEPNFILRKILKEHEVQLPPFKMPQTVPMQPFCCVLAPAVFRPPIWWHFRILLTVEHCDHCEHEIHNRVWVLELELNELRFWVLLWSFSCASFSFQFLSPQDLERTWGSVATLQDATDCPDAAVLLCPCASCLQTTHLVAL